VPLLVYLVGVPSAHVAIGTAAIAVALNAAFGLTAHAQLGTVKWPCAIVFSIAGMTGAFLGSMLGKALDGTYLLALFGVPMIAGGVAGIALGTKVNVKLAGHRRALAGVFAAVVIAVGLYMIVNGLRPCFLAFRALSARASRALRHF
jgi:uncharacterized protein